jgi:hypothetical protein
MVKGPARARPPAQKSGILEAPADHTPRPSPGHYGQYGQYGRLACFPTEPRARPRPAPRPLRAAQRRRPRRARSAPRQHPRQPRTVAARRPRSAAHASPARWPRPAVEPRLPPRVAARPLPRSRRSPLPRGNPKVVAGALGTYRYVGESCGYWLAVLPRHLSRGERSWCHPLPNVGELREHCFRCLGAACLPAELLPHQLTDRPQSASPVARAGVALAAD